MEQYQSVHPESVTLDPASIRSFIYERIEWEKKQVIPNDLQSVSVKQAKISAYLYVRLRLLGIPIEAAYDAPLGSFNCVEDES